MRGVIFCCLVLLAATAPGPARAQTPEPEGMQWRIVKAGIRARHPQVPQLSVSTLRAWQGNPQAPRPLLLDTRDAPEFADSHLPGAHHAPTLAAALALLDQHRQTPVVVLYCSVGERSSALAAQLLARLRAEAANAPPVLNLEGSIFEWANQGLPLAGAQGLSGLAHPYDRWWGRLLKRERWSREP
jgi:rhodanese-related sulfurtransferase